MADVRAKIPGWLDALNEEAKAHETAFAYEFDSIAGIPVRHMSLLDMARLDDMGISFGTGKIPTLFEFTNLPQAFDEGVNFLLYMHRDQSRCRVVNLYRRIKYSSKNKEQIYYDIIRYLNRTFIDSIGTWEDRSKRPINYWASCINYIDMLAKEYGWTDDYVVNMPYRRLIQCIRKIMKRNDPKMPISSAADRVVAQYLAQKNKRPTK